MMLNQFLINTAASQFRNNKRKPPWEDKKNYRVSKRGYHSHCHLWHNADEVADVRDAVWQARRKKRLTTLTLIAQCGSDRCVRLTHLTTASQSDIEFINLLREERKDWRYNMGSIRLLARSMAWDENEIGLVLRIPRGELKEMLENGPVDDVPYGQRDLGAASEQPNSSANAVVPNTDRRPVRPQSERHESPDQFASPADAMPSLPLVPTAVARGPLGNPSNLTARPGSGQGTLELTWSPAANATAQFMYFHPDGSAEAHRLPEQIPGNCGEVSLSDLETGRYWFILIACQKFSEDEDTVWSSWSEWAMADVS